MKLGDLLSKYQEWRELVWLVNDLVSSAERHKNTPLYVFGLQLVKLIGKLASKPIQLDEVELAEVERI